MHLRRRGSKEAGDLRSWFLRGSIFDPLVLRYPRFPRCSGRRLAAGSKSCYGRAAYVAPPWNSTSCPRGVLDPRSSPRAPMWRLGMDGAGLGLSGAPSYEVGRGRVCALWSYDLQPPNRAPVRDAPLRGGKVRPLRGPPLWGGRKAGQIFASPLCDPQGSKGQRC